MGTHLNNLDDVAQLPCHLHHPCVVAVVVCVVVCVYHGGCGQSIMAVGGGGHWQDAWGGRNSWCQWWWLGGQNC